MNDQPKTKRIKERLHRYTALLRDIDNQRERLDRMEATIGSPSGPDLSGMPRPQGGVSNPVAAAVEKKMELEAKIRQKEAEEKAERRAIEAMTELMDDPDERLTISSSISTGPSGRTSPSRCMATAPTLRTKRTPTKGGCTESTAGPS